MEKQYLLSVDQSTQGTKALLFDQEGNLICRGDRPHRQIIKGKPDMQGRPAPPADYKRCRVGIP